MINNVTPANLEDLFKRNDQKMTPASVEDTLARAIDFVLRDKTAEFERDIDIHESREEKHWTSHDSTGTDGIQ